MMKYSMVAIAFVLMLVISGCASTGRKPAQTLHPWDNRPSSEIQEPSLAYRFASGLAAANPGYGRPDAFGPYGVWGPTWESFNHRFSSAPPHPTLIMPLGPGQSPVLLIPQ